LAKKLEKTAQDLTYPEKKKEKLQLQKKRISCQGKKPGPNGQKGGGRGV